MCPTVEQFLVKLHLGHTKCFMDYFPLKGDPAGRKIKKKGKKNGACQVYKLTELEFMYNIDFMILSYAVASSGS